jgi:hypothetical protein
MQRALSNAFGRDHNSLRSHTALTDDQIIRVAPSIYAPEPHESRSERYAYIPTIDVLNGLRKEGFEPFAVVQSRCRLPGKSEFTKHMIRMRHVDTIMAPQANEIILLNSHDGTSSYQLLSGVFRFVCQNGMVAGQIMEDIRIGHRGNARDIRDDVIEGAYTVLQGFERVDASREHMQAERLSHEEQQLFAQAALMLRYDTDDTGKAPIKAEQLLRPQRREDLGEDLWTTFNVVQENALKGGLRGRTANNARTTTRAVTGISQDLKLNQALWVLAEGMRQLKSAAA